MVGAQCTTGDHSQIHNAHHDGCTQHILTGQIHHAREGGRRKEKKEEGKRRRKKKQEEARRRKKQEETGRNRKKQEETGRQQTKNQMHHLSHLNPLIESIDSIHWFNPLVYLWPKNPNTAPICVNPAFKKSFLTNAGGTKGMNNPPNKGVSWHPTVKHAADMTWVVPVIVSNCIHNSFPPTFAKTW